MTVQYDIASPPVELIRESFSAIIGWHDADLEPALRSFQRSAHDILGIGRAFSHQPQYAGDRALWKRATSDADFFGGSAG